MKIALLSDSETEINFLPQLKKKLLGKIADAKIEIQFAPSLLDLPLKAKQLAKSSSLVFVFSLYGEDDKEKAEMVLEKLVNIELATNKKIVKAIEEYGQFEFSEEELQEGEKEILAKKWADFIVKLLFNPEKFSPEEAAKKDD